MCVQSQESLVRGLGDTEGLCESPHDFPAKWAAMIFGYFDESGGDIGDGYFVVAGFIGKRKCWKDFARKWTVAAGDHGALHMKELRLGSKRSRIRYRDLLKRLGQVPFEVGLRPFVGSVKTSDYQHLIKDTVAELVLKGYSVALTAMVGAILESNLPKSERIEFIFETQVEFAIMREQAFAFWRQLPVYKCPNGKSRISKLSSMDKSILLEASDYLAYAVLQQLIDPSSEKSEITSPILEPFKSKIPHGHLSKEQAEYLINYAANETGGLTPMDKHRKAYLKERLKIEHKLGIIY